MSGQNSKDINPGFNPDGNSTVFSLSIIKSDKNQNIRASVSVDLSKMNPNDMVMLIGILNRQLHIANYELDAMQAKQIKDLQNSKKITNP